MQPARYLLPRRALVAAMTAVVLGLHAVSAVSAAPIEEAKLTASDAVANALFGVSVSVDGDTAIVGAYKDSDPISGGNNGAAYVYVRSGTTWTEQAKLTASDAADDDSFGISVAISGDTVVIGAHDDDDAGTDSGSAYVFTRSGATWSEQAKITASDAASGSRFGTSVAMSGDTTVIGAHVADVPAVAGYNHGAAYVFRLGDIDTDGDGLYDDEEVTLGTDPNDPDSDDDGQSDGDEVACGSDPLDDTSLSADHDGDAIPDCVDDDDDNDGVLDRVDAVPLSNLDPTVVIGLCDSQVRNQVLADGTTFNDVITQCRGIKGEIKASEAMRCIGKASQAWRVAHLISGREYGAIRRCAARSNGRP